MSLRPAAREIFVLSISFKGHAGVPGFAGYEVCGSFVLAAAAYRDLEPDWVLIIDAYVIYLDAWYI